MASPEEVAVPTVDDMVMVKVEDADHHDPNKAQVILQLQQITGDESSEASAAVMAVEAAPEQGDEEVEIGCPITCGDCKAVLILKKFVCPGINVKCVKFGDQLISPKQFVHLSGKATLKDWKRAIRMNGVMLRKMMDSGQLDFYEHTTLCTNTCRSTKFDLLINNTRFPPDGTGLTTPTSSQGLAVVGNGSSGGDVQTDLSAKMEWSSGDPAEKSNEISEDTLNFWKGIADVGLLGEVVTNINTELLALLNGVQQRSEPGVLQDTDSCLVEVAVLSNLAQVFGLLDTVKRLLERRREQMDPSQEDELRLLANLEIQLEEQKKQQQVRALLSCPQPPKMKSPSKRPPKRPRLTRPASTTTLQTTNLQPQQFTVLSPISLTSVGQPLTVAGLPIGSLAQTPNTVTLLPAGSQFFTRYMVAGGDGKTDTITLHPSSGLTLNDSMGFYVQDQSQLGTMMNPVELVQLSQQGGATEVVPLDGQVVMQQEADSQDQALGVMELQLTGDAAKDTMMVQSGMEVAMETQGDESQCQTQGGQTDTTHGLQLDSSGQLQNVQIVVLEN